MPPLSVPRLPSPVDAASRRGLRASETMHKVLMVSWVENRSRLSYVRLFGSGRICCNRMLEHNTTISVCLRQVSLALIHKAFQFDEILRYSNWVERGATMRHLLETLEALIVSRGTGASVRPARHRTAVLELLGSPKMPRGHAALSTQHLLKPADVTSCQISVRTHNVSRYPA